MCRLSITQTEKRCSAIDGGNGKAPSLFETIGGVTPTLRLVSSFQPGLAGAPQGPGFLYSSRFGGGSLPTPLPARGPTHGGWLWILIYGVSGAPPLPFKSVVAQRGAASSRQ